MEEPTLFKVSLICSLIGTLAIIFISENLEPQIFKISAIDLSKIDQEVKIIGNVSSIRQTKGLTILSVKDSSGVIPVVVFKQGDENFQKGSKVEIAGKISEFNNQPQITAKTVKTV